MARAPDDQAEIASARRIRAVTRRLREQHGTFSPKPRRTVLDELVLTLLSQHTSDVNRDRAFARLKQRFPRWQDVAAAPVTELEEAIRPGGIARIKSRRIHALLHEVEQREGRLDLERLNGLGDAEVTTYLCSLPGVGPKSAACVLLFAMDRPAFPIDTHVHRICRRLGLIPDDMSADKAHELLSPRVPAELRYELHVLLITHGRAVCTAQRPACGDCSLFDLCEAGPAFVAAGAARDAR